jgi:hypothetical protein
MVEGWLTPPKRQTVHDHRFPGPLSEDEEDRHYNLLLKTRSCRGVPREFHMDAAVKQRKILPVP